MSFVASPLTHHHFVVKHIPDIRLNLISAGKLDDEGFSSNFSSGQWKLSKGSMTVARGKKYSSLYFMQAKIADNSINTVKNEDTIELWHRRLGHMSEKGLIVLAKKNLLSGMKNESLNKCIHCLAGKQTRATFKTSPPSRKSGILELVYSDVCGPMKTKTLGGAFYFVTFIDDHSRKLWVYTLKTKDQVLDVFKQFQALVERQTRKKLKCIRTDNGDKVWSENDVSYDHLRVFGCKAFMHIPKDERSKLDVKTRQCVFLGYGQDEFGYRFYDPVQKKLVRSRDAIFIEDQTIQDIEKLKEEMPQYSDTLIDLDPVPPTQPTDEVEDGQHSTEAVESEQRKEWIDAMQGEMKSLHENHTFELVKLPKDKRALKNNWVYRIKQEEYTSQPRYKARLVVKGFSQRKGVDFDEIFSPVVKMSSIRVVLGIAASLDLEIEQMDVKTAFLHGDLDKKIYMEQPEGFKIKGKEYYVCKLKKSLYGLKQAPRQWYKKFESVMGEQGYRKTSSDHCVFIQKFSDDDFIILLLYVDDMLIVGRNTFGIDWLKKQLSKSFAMKDLGPAKQILGIRIHRDRAAKKLCILQEHYIEKVLERFNMSNAKVVSTPLATHFRLSTKQSLTTDKEKKDMEKVPYASAVGSLMYAMVCTRPDIAHAVGVVSRFLSNPGREHWNAVKWIMRYLRGTSNFKLTFGSGKPLLVGYTDSDMAGDVDTRKSTMGYLMTLSGGAVAWQSRLQKCVALSTTEAEFIAATETCKELLWMKRFLQELDFKQQQYVVFCDNQSAIHLSKNSSFHAKSKHIDVRYHWLRDALNDNMFELEKIHTDHNASDMLTKTLPREKLEVCCSIAGLTNLSTQ
ncbi:Retrovirus-related Pol polyprotein from transposon TNT 1-94 [Melia azedarach]|uniref:Retrovirus-related Pol polyprotein from transposon TNT 1-94 n=1 Tax=Melia azedarach TaxID=155640 RepID=A0ACC1Y1T2_MELAZ|nr:Retrovirus-related Pol polyprotein from transposon TNT 1-94 [Melia azedarach]